MQDLYYRNPGGTPLGGMVFALIVGLAAAFALSAAYAAAIWFGPFVLANIVLAALGGILLGLSVGRAARRGRVRSVGALMWLAALTAAAFEYSQWAGYLTLFSNAGPGNYVGVSKGAFAHASFEVDTFIYMLAHPADMLNMANTINQHGFWSFYKHIPTGLALWAIWAAEALIIFIAAQISAYKQIDYPYSDVAERWMDKLHPPLALPYIDDPKQFARGLETRNYQLIINSETMPDKKRETRARLTLYTCPGDAHVYLSITNFKAGRRKVESATVVKYLKLDYSAGMRIARHMGLKSLS